MRLLKYYRKLREHQRFLKRHIHENDPLHLLPNFILYSPLGVYKIDLLRFNVFHDQGAKIGVISVIASSLTRCIA